MHRQEWASALATKSRSLIVELVGPAGAGKTAVLRAIHHRDPQIRAGLSIDRLRFASVLARHASALLLVNLELLWRRPRSWWPSMVHLLRLRTLPSVLAREACVGYRAIILDEGPIFSLARLSVLEDAPRVDGRPTQEWRRALARYIDCLDGIVWLDAADPVLMRRIRERDKAHQIKSGTDVEVARFLARYRQAYHDVLGDLRAAGSARVIEFDTTSQTPEQVAAAILTALPRLHAPPNSRPTEDR